MSIKAQFTDRTSTGLSFQLDGEAELARKIATAEDVLDILKHLMNHSAPVPLGMTRAVRAVVYEAMLHYWSDLAVRVEAMNTAKGTAKNEPEPLSDSRGGT